MDQPIALTEEQAYQAMGNVVQTMAQAGFDLDWRTAVLYGAGTSVAMVIVWEKTEDEKNR